MVVVVCAAAAQAGIEWTPSLKVAQLTVYHSQRAHEQNHGNYSVPQCNQALSYVRDGRNPSSSIAYPNPGEVVVVKLSNRGILQSDSESRDGFELLFDGTLKTFTDNFFDYVKGDSANTNIDESKWRLDATNKAISLPSGS